MKRLLIVICSIIPALGFAQHKSIKVNKVHPAVKGGGNRKYDLEDKSDSAHIYYFKGWDAYKLKDLDAARYYWERGANCTSNIPSKYSSAFRYALMLQDGEGISPDKDAAFYFYTVGAADGLPEGDVDATKNVASYYENGISVKQDYKKALEWYLKAKAQGNKYCDTDIVRIKQKLAK